MFNEEKATELAVCMLSWGGSMKFIKLLKLIYLADREALDREGHSISTDRWVSMKHGPVPIQTYNLIHQEDDPDRHPVWNQYIENQADYSIGLKKEMGINHLSEAERAIAEDVWKQYGHLPPWVPMVSSSLLTISPSGKIPKKIRTVPKRLPSLSDASCSP